MIMAVCNVGRCTRYLFGNIDLINIPYMFTPKGTNQNFGKAFDAVAAQLQSGVPCTISKAGVINCPVNPQPWFTAMMGGTGSSFCSNPVTASPIDCTQAAALFDQANGNPFWPAHGAGALWTLLEPSFATGPMTLANTQVGSLDWSGSFTSPNSRAGFVTLRYKAERGLPVDAIDTSPHCLAHL